MKCEKGFTLVEMLIVLAMTFVLLVVAGSLTVKVKDRITFDTQLQQLKLLTYEAYSLASINVKSFYIICGTNTPYLYSYSPRTEHRRLQLLRDTWLSCTSTRGDSLHYTHDEGLHNSGTVSFHNDATGEVAEYAVHFTYGRIIKR